MTEEAEEQFRMDLIHAALYGAMSNPTMSQSSVQDMEDLAAGVLIAVDYILQSKQTGWLPKHLYEQRKAS